MTKETKEPTRIVKEPEVISGSHGDEMIITCDNGKLYSMSELADIVGIAQGSFSKRLSNLGWRHEMILAKKWQRTVGITGKSIENVVEAGDLAGKYQGRQTSSERREPLSRIATPSAFEENLWK